VKENTAKKDKDIPFKKKRDQLDARLFKRRLWGGGSSSVPKVARRSGDSRGDLVAGAWEKKMWDCSELAEKHGPATQSVAEG